MIQVRQLAAVEMRKRIAQNSGDFWTQLPQSDREQIKVNLPEVCLSQST
jgi:importin-4